MDTEKLLKEIREKIDELVEKAKEAGAEAREEMEDVIEDLKKQRDKLEDKLQDFKTKNEPKFEEAKFHLRKAAEELEQAVKKMFRKGPGATEV
ncbi:MULTISPECIES: hypothetical protein [Roseivirga]|jgi:F0F1-type ATP synthase membrane subunit b/b'|uniref:Uncharacterized protein n=1 Tax=Roseivirga thermotolerans TaxID=1758176 RepID=A0ABQ3I423_9BACT|nr:MULTISPECIES: hypothetical protein [Roseivirga]MEC7756039.1 hypothetical protein [Bacteroidota bacterium]GHE62368.1 hypothetical protein GCM10011340_16930 [Roseivirga thermotolerans]|tara:strand:- start:3181 stop:3459 length:279 start_codon:yes stop_codon:yes gene_type:complete